MNPDDEFGCCRERATSHVAARVEVDADTGEMFAAYLDAGRNLRQAEAERDDAAERAKQAGQAWKDAYQAFRRAETLLSKRLYNGPVW